jgi:hypothetical protein
MRTITHLFRHSEGLTLDCTLEYSPAERATDIDPAWPASAVLISAKAGGVDISPLLDNRIVAMIEEGAVWSQS